MKRFKTTILPTNLQYFADPNSGQDDVSTQTDSENATEQSEHSDSEPGGEDNFEHSDSDDKNDAIIEKLKGRIGKEQGQKNALQEQLNKAQAELEKLRDGKKTPKEPDPTPEQQEVSKLRAELKRRDTVEGTSNVFSENGVNVPKDIVEILVTDDPDKSVDNASKLLNFVTEVQKQTETSIRKEYQGGHLPEDTKHGAESLSEYGKKVAESGQARASLDSFK